MASRGAAQLAKCKHLSSTSPPTTTTKATTTATTTSSWTRPPCLTCGVPTRWVPLTGNNRAKNRRYPARKSLHLDSSNNDYCSWDYAAPREIITFKQLSGLGTLAFGVMLDTICSPLAAGSGASPPIPRPRTRPRRPMKVARRPLHAAC